MRNITKYQYLTPEQAQALLKAADPEWQGMILLGRTAGARLLDAANLRWSDVDMNGREIRFLVRNSESRLVVPMTTDLYSYFARRTRTPALEAPVFPSCFKDAQESPGKLARRFRWLQAKAGLAPVGFNCLRRTFVRSMMVAGVPERMIAKLMGYHHWKYAFVRQEDLAKAVAKLPPITG